MSNAGNKVNIYYFIYITFYLFISCKKQSNNNKLYEKSVSIISISEYNSIYKKSCDSLLLWNQYDLESYWIRYNQLYKLDSLLCFNSKKNRFIGSIHRYTNGTCPSDELLFILGEKINKQWYFFSGSTSIVLPRKLYQKNETTPLSYQQLHQIALKEVYGGYLNKDGTINEHWFISHFEGAGWVNWDDTPEKIKSYTRKDYEQFHLKVIRNNWSGVKKDSVKQLEKKDEALP